jgi:hypothetical protein
MVDTETILIAGLAAVSAYAGGQLLDDESGGGQAPASTTTKQATAAGRTDKQRSGGAQTGMSDRRVQDEATKEFEQRGIKTGDRDVNPETGGVTTGTQNPTVTAPQTGDTSEDGTINVGELSERAQESNLSEEDKEAFRTLSISN